MTQDTCEIPPRYVSTTVKHIFSKFPVLKAIVEHRYFVRLNDILQLGTIRALNEFSGACHTRAEHSIGVMFLCYEFCNAVKLGDQGTMSECIAALCHDVGHGPFSHTFEVVLKRAQADADPNGDPQKINHEDCSVQIIQQILLDIHQKDPGLVPNPDEIVAQVKCLINPKDGQDIGQFKLPYIVANPHSGLDVDKFDYLCRDPFNTYKKDVCQENKAGYEFASVCDCPSGSEENFVYDNSTPMTQGASQTLQNRESQDYDVNIYSQLSDANLDDCMDMEYQCSQLDSTHSLPCLESPSLNAQAAFSIKGPANEHTDDIVDQFIRSEFTAALDGDSTSGLSDEAVRAVEQYKRIIMCVRRAQWDKRTGEVHFNVCDIGYLKELLLQRQSMFCRVYQKNTSISIGLMHQDMMMDGLYDDQQTSSPNGQYQQQLSLKETLTVLATNMPLNPYTKPQIFAQYVDLTDSGVLRHIECMGQHRRGKQIFDMVYKHKQVYPTVATYDDKCDIVQVIVQIKNSNERNQCQNELQTALNKVFCQRLQQAVGHHVQLGSGYSVTCSPTLTMPFLHVELTSRDCGQKCINPLFAQSFVDDQNNRMHGRDLQEASYIETTQYFEMQIILRTVPCEDAVFDWSQGLTAKDYKVRLAKESIRDIQQEFLQYASRKYHS